MSTGTSPSFAGAQVFAPGRVAFVTGAGSGIGKAVCKNCASRGMKVVLCDFNESALKQAEAEVRALGADTLALRMDVTKPADWNRARDEAIQRFGEVAFFHNNVGTSTGANGNLWELPPEDWTKVMDVNLHGVLHGVRALVPSMLSSKRPGCIVNTSSGAGVYNTPTGINTAPIYTVSKYGVTLVTETLANDIRQTGAPISVHALHPMVVQTNFGRNQLKTAAPGEDVSADRQTMLDKLGQTAEELAEHMISSCISATPEHPHFYIFGSDTQVNEAMFKEMLRWQAEDFIEDRPAMSQETDGFRDSFLQKVREVKKKTMAPRTKANL